MIKFFLSFELHIMSIIELCPCSVLHQFPAHAACMGQEPVLVFVCMRREQVVLAKNLTSSGELSEKQD